MAGSWCCNSSITPASDIHKPLKVGFNLICRVVWADFILLKRYFHSIPVPIQENNTAREVYCPISMSPKMDAYSRRLNTEGFLMKLAAKKYNFRISERILVDLGLLHSNCGGL